MSARTQIQTARGQAPTQAPHGASLLQRACACGGAAGLDGLCAACRSAAVSGPRPPLVQAKLAVGRPNDRYEQEADRVAEQVLRTPEPGRALGHQPLAATITPLVQRACPACGSLEEDVQRAPDRSQQLEIRRSGATETPEAISSSEEEAGESAVEAAVVRGCASGRPLATPIRERMEERFGIHFGNVHVHTGVEANRAADEIDALAFTHGRDIYFAAGTYAPGTPTGDQLLAHELTHVVQQAGGIRMRPGAGIIQRARLSGRGFHAETEKRFTAANSGIITEAPIPGATSTSHGYQFDKLGWADLYKSSDANTAIGVRGRWKTAEGVNASDDPSKTREYVDLSPRERKAKCGGKEGVTYSPTVKAKGEPLSAEFPESAYVGDIKPMWFRGTRAMFGEGGVDQLANYRSGLERFAAQAAQDKKVSRGRITTRLLTGLTIPAELDFKLMNADGSSPSTNAIRTTDGGRRYWMYEPPGTALYFYFSLPIAGASKEELARLETTLQQLQPIKNELKTRDNGIHSKLNLTTQGKRRPGARSRLTRARAGRATNRKAVQRKASPRVKQDWKRRENMWEKKRADWDRQFAKPFLNAKHARTIAQMASISDAIGYKRAHPASLLLAPAGKLKTIELWSGQTGQNLGKARFRLGAAFDKIADAFEGIKQKLGKLWKRVSGIREGKGFTWRSRLLNLLLRTVKLGFRELVSVFFELCAECTEGIFNKVIARFSEDISEELEQNIDHMRAKFERYEKELKTTVEERFAGWESLIKDLEGLHTLLKIVSAMEGLIRFGVQIVGCLTPPALGCLWALVVQVGLEIALDLLVGTEWFQKNIINHQSVRDVIKDFASPAIRSLMADALRNVGLDDYAKDVEPCNKVKQLGAASSPMLQPLVGDFQAHRASWEHTYRQEMLQDLKGEIESRPGVPATEAELEQIVATLRRSSKTSETLRAAIQSGLRLNNGKHSVQGLIRHIAGAPPRPPAAVLTERGERRVKSGVQIGPQVLPPPPGAPPGSDPTVVPGVSVEF